MSGPWKISTEEEYRRCPEVKKSEVDMIKEWLTKQPHLPPISENQIIVYLRACKFSLEKTKEALDLNFTIRTRCPEFFSDRRLEKIPNTYKNMLVLSLQPIKVLRETDRRRLFDAILGVLNRRETQHWLILTSVQEETL